MAIDAYTTTCRQLRGIAESLLAGPQFRATGTIRLAVRPAGFVGTALPVEVQGTDFAWPEGRVALSGPLPALEQATGLAFGPPEGVYTVVDPLPADAVLDLDAAAANDVYRSLYAGGQALVTFAPDEHPVLWPEHFDVSVVVDEVNYGVSPGDSFHERAYAYVSPWQSRSGEFWNAPFGAARALDLAVSETDLTDSIVDFFERGRNHL
ncbi:hypothetical protein [Mycolicibacterium komossense]|uniref:Uncharacterized protein n=1 Tax=Mycolicibacterium komossense TaxID=1779 RepID=A0ABT3CBK3_9MYCO|nr:hypothetical protein [Mycolicibacterium komossense]MCV7226840.1 hypothetical protein [Mycolicibacterium komossense]